MSLFPKLALYYQALVGIPRGPLSNVFIVDPINGSDSNPGTTFESPLLTVKAAYDLCTTNQNDAVLVVGGPTANALAAAFQWNKAYTHLIGLSADIPGVGQRTRITGSSALDLAYLIDFSASGCIVKNIQFFNNNDLATAHGAVKVTADRLYFENCFFVGHGSGNNTNVGTYDLLLTSEECVFKNCTFGSHTIANGIASQRLWVSGVSGGKEAKFLSCEFFNWSTVTTTAMVRIVNSVTTEGFIMQFKDCLFDNLIGGATMANVFEDAAVEANHQIILKDCMMVGITGVADNLGDVWMNNPVPVNTGLPSINPAG